MLAGGNGSVQKQSLRNYLAIARFDHWIKQIFIMPGVAVCFALMGLPVDNGFLIQLGINLALGFFATSAVASANYVINEYLDTSFDRYHPTKKFRSAVLTQLNPTIVYTEYGMFATVGLVLAWFVNRQFFLANLWLLVMGILYNVRPIRMKDIPYIDVLSESINNAIRLLLGWFIITSDYLPPVTIVLGYWMGGAFLMTVKRFSEYRMIADKTIAALYRKSFAHYNEKSLLISGIFYALLSIFFCGIFMIKYRIELLIAIPLFCGLFCYYLNIAYKEDSSAQKPEKLFKEKGLMLLVTITIIVTIAMMFIDVPPLKTLLDTTFIGTG